MKKIILALLVAVGMFATPQQAKSQHVSVSFQLFYDELSPYGMWVDYPSYGYVWVPNAGYGFRPYATEGYWVYTDAGWTWVSYYSWGWAPFHYGRWDYDPYYGYIWIPGNEWGPAWVSWRHCDGYYGWTALGPGVSWSVGYASYNPAPERWIFVHEHDFGRRNINNYYVNQSNNVTIINNTTVINNTIVNNSRHETYIAGPDRAQVQKVSGKPVTPVAIADNSRPAAKMSNDKLSIYRPKVENAPADRKPAPSKVYTPAEAKPILEKKGVGNANAPANKRLDNREVTPAGKVPATQKRDLNAPGNEKRAIQPSGAPMNEPRKVEPQQKRDNPQRVNPNEPVNNKRMQLGEVNPTQKREQPAERVIPNEPRMRGNQPDDRMPVRPKEVTPPQQREQPVQRVNPSEPRMRQNQPDDRVPVQPRQVNPPQQREQPAQRVIPQEQPRGNDFRQTPPQNNPRPVQPREMNPPQQPMQRVNPNPEPVRPQNFNQPNNQRMPVQGPHRPH